jgi:hypothetical protein
VKGSVRPFQKTKILLPIGQHNATAIVRVRVIRRPMGVTVNHQCHIVFHKHPFDGLWVCVHDVQRRDGFVSIAFAAQRARYGVTPRCRQAVANFAK